MQLMQPTTLGVLCLGFFLRSAACAADLAGADTLNYGTNSDSRESTTRATNAPNSQGRLEVSGAAPLHPQLGVILSPARVMGSKALFPLALKNGLAEKAESARATMFLLDEKGTVVGRATRWIVGGETNRPPLEAGATNTFYFLVPTGGNPFVTTRLTVTQVKTSQAASGPILSRRL